MAFTGLGTGSLADPYQITTLEQLNEIRDDLTAYYKLMKNLDFDDDGSYSDAPSNKPIYTTGSGWTPISGFSGGLYGNEKTISNLFIDRDSTSDVGLIAVLGANGFIRNLQLTDVNVTGKNRIGSLVGHCSGTVSNCKVSGTVVGENDVGGFSGYIEASYTNKGTCLSCGSACNVSGKLQVGGFVGYFYNALTTNLNNPSGLIYNCYSTGNVTRLSGTNTRIGGFCGWNYQGRIINSYSTGAVIYDGEANPTDKGFVGGHDNTLAWVDTGNCFDSTTSAQLTTTGNASAKTTAEMKDITTFQDDFTDSWVIFEKGDITYTENNTNVLKLSGSNQVSVGSANYNTGKLSLSVKFKLTSYLTAVAGLISWGTWSQDVSVYIRNDESQFSIVSGTGARYEVSFPKGILNHSWHNLIVTMDTTSAETKVYLDGIYLGTITCLSGGGNLPLTNNLFFGSLNSTNYFPGLLSDIRIYNNILSDAERLSIFANENITNNLVGHWVLNEGSGTTLTDSVGGKNGTIVSPTWTKDDVNPSYWEIDDSVDYPEINPKWSISTQIIEINESLFLSENINIKVSKEVLNINETYNLSESVISKVSNEYFNVDENFEVSEQVQFDRDIKTDESFIVSDDVQLIPYRKVLDINESLSVEDSIFMSNVPDSHYVSKIISYNPLIYVTNTNPATIVKVDITDPNNPIKQVYTIINNSYAKDVVYNSENEYFYVICADGKIVKINKDNLNNQIIIDTLETENLINVDAIESSFLTYSSTDNENGKIVMLDEREIKKINFDLRWKQLIQKTLSMRLDSILGKKLNFDLRWKATAFKKISFDLRWLKDSYNTVSQHPITYTDWQVYINGVELTPIDDVDMNSIIITHDITEEEHKASNVLFILNRRHDKLNYTNTNIASEITNHNTVVIKIKGITEFTGKISNLTCNSEVERVDVVAIGHRPTDKRHKINISMASINEPLHLYHCLINDVNIDNPYIDPDDENPEYYKGIQADLGTQIEQNIIRGIFISSLGTTGLVEEIENGEFQPQQNWSYFWLAKFRNFLTGWWQGSLQYLGTSLGSLTIDAWEMLGASYYIQRQFDDKETELGFYQVGEAPYLDIASKNGQKITKFKFVDKTDGLYSIKDEGYNYTEYAKRIADLEYQKLLNINDEILPKTSTNLSLSIDAYYYYNISLLTRINITNTTTTNIYNHQNGFPVAVKNIRIQCSQEGENSMIVILTCDNAKSQLELEEIDAQTPDENSDEFIEAEKTHQRHRKFDPNTWSYPV